MKTAVEIATLLKWEHDKLTAKINREGLNTSPYTLEKRDYLGQLLDEIGQPRVGMFYVFGWEQWEQRGGVNDLLVSYETFEKAKSFVDEHPTKPATRYQIVFFNADGSIKVAATKRHTEWSLA